VSGPMLGLRRESQDSAGREEARLVLEVASGPSGEPSGVRKSPFTPTSGACEPPGAISRTVCLVRASPSPPSSRAATTRRSSSQRARSATARCTAHGPRGDHAKWWWTPSATTVVRSESGASQSWAAAGSDAPGPPPFGAAHPENTARSSSAGEREASDLGGVVAFRRGIAGAAGEVS